MGAWGAGCFENDDALDWLEGLYQSSVKRLFKRTNPSKFIARTLVKVTSRANSKYLDSVDCSCALAACEILAAKMGNPPPDLHDETKEWLDTNTIEGARDLVSLGISAISRIRSNSELKDLWEESDSLGEWTQVMEGLNSRMQTSGA